MNLILETIIMKKEEEIRELQSSGTYQHPTPPFPLRNFKRAISKPDTIHVIGEIKFASPSAGPILKPRNPVTIAKIYEQAGVSAISVITEREFFHGSLASLLDIKGQCSLPILRKDFIFHESQLLESLNNGADAVLLIARLVSARKLKDLISLTQDLGMAALVEIHDERDLEKAMQGGAQIIGINNRDLNSFKVDLATTKRLAPKVQPECVLVSESGISSESDIVALSRFRINAVLVGTALMKSPTIGDIAKRLSRVGSEIYKRVN